MLENGKTTGKGIGFISGKNRETFMSYSELCRRSLRILHVLQKRGVEPGQEIVFQLENNEHFISLFWACLFGGMIPVPVTVGHNDEHKRKLFGIWRVLNHPFLVAEPESIVHLQKFAFANGLDGDLQRMMKESEFYDNLAMGSTPGIIHPSRVEDMAFIQFSSGSTGAPKGVIITHANALANTRAINQGYGTTVNDSVLSWVPLTHDMGLAAIHLTAAEAGIDQYIMPPDLFVRNPMLWLDKAHEHRITFLSSPNFGYRHFLNHYHPEEEGPWDLSSVRLILNGAEPISRTLCQEFHEALVPYGLNPNATLPAYGMAEATVVVSLGRLGEALASSTVDRTALQVGSRVEELPADAPGSLTLVDVGLPIEDCEFRICDDKDQVLEDRMLGHVQIRGRNVSCGYYNNPEATAAVLTPDGWLRTGDLGFIRDGRLVMAGRAKDVIFVNGQNIYPHDLEQIAGGLEGLDPGKVAACGIPDPTGERENIVFFAVFRKGVRAFAPLAEQIKRRVFHETGLEAYAVLPIRHIPKTTSGKPQRYKLAARYEAGEFAETVRLLEDLKTELSPDGGDRTPREGLERQLSELWSAVLGTGPIGLHDHLIEFGAHSLTLLRLMDAMEKELKRRIRLSELVSHPTVHTFAEYLRQDKAGSSAAAYSDFSVQAGQGRNEPFPLTEVQTAYWLGRRPEYELGGISSHYYMEIETKLSLPRLEEALQQLIRMHPMLRMIVTVDGEQQILPEVPYYPILAEDIRRLTPEEQISRIEERRECMSHRVFVPGRWPLFEMEAVKVSEDTHRLFIGFDLLMADGYSLRLFARDWLACFEHPGKRFPECSFTFRDYITAYLRMREAPMYQEDRSYWMKRLDSLPPSPALPLTAPVLSVAKPRFKRLQAEVPELAWEALRRRCAAIRVTPSALLCTAYAEVLAYWSNQSRFTLNVTAFNRYPFHDEVNRVIGDFTSLMLVDVELGEGETFKQRTGRMQERMMEVLQHRHFDGVEVIRELAKARQVGNSAIMPVVFTSLLFDDNDDEWSRIGTTQWAISQTSQVYLDHQVMESGGKLNVNWDYVEDLFEPEVIEGMFRQYMELLLTLAETWETAKLQPPAQDLKLISRFNRTEEAILPATLHGLFEHQALRTPEAPAIVLGGASASGDTARSGYTYWELQQRSARIARYLRGQGIGRGDTVAVLAERRPETAANVLGVLKAGAAYVPVDPQYPLERRQYILANAGCRLLLEADLYERERLAACELADDASGEEMPEARPEDLAYIIYTSGSTGQPKGVAVRHDAAVNTIVDINRKFKVGADDRLLGLSSMGFDLSVYDLFGALAAGAALVMVPDHRDMAAVLQTVETEGITVWNSVPALMELALDAAEPGRTFRGLRTALLSGDWIPLSLPDKLRSTFPQAEVVSLGGATEAAVWSIYYPVGEVQAGWSSIPYGRPLANQTWHVLNEAGRLCPVGVEGELYIGGRGLAEGYQGDPGKTAEAFISHPELGRLYRTGDYGVLRREGVIEFRGRKDQQVKLRGYRIELGEIRSRLSEHPAVRQAVVIDRNDGSGKKYLCAYIVQTAGNSADLTPDQTAELKQHLHDRLPEYMVPAFFVGIADVPLTANGKIDRKALPEPAAMLAAGTLPPAAPSRPIEHRLQEIWAELLKSEAIGVHDSFFDLGGDSLQAQQLINRMESRFGVRVPIRSLFAEPTIARLADLILGEAHEQVEHRSRAAAFAEAGKGLAARPSESVYYWSPAAAWEKRQDRLIIGSKTYSGGIVHLFPELYFMAQKGVTLRSLNSSFPGVGESELQRFADELIGTRVLINSPLTPQELFASQTPLVENRYGDGLFTDEEVYKRFKSDQLTRSSEWSSVEGLALEDHEPYLPWAADRQSHREFDESTLVPFRTLSGLLSIFRQRRTGDDIRYYYASAGGLYPIDVYVYVKKDRVERLSQGLYYYEPAANKLHPVDSGMIGEDAHYFSNRNLFRSSAFSVFFLYNAEASMPRYGGMGYYLAALDTGIMVQALTQAACMSGIGLCSVGDMNSSKIMPMFRSGRHTLLMHTVEGGWIRRGNGPLSDSTASADPAVIRQEAQADPRPKAEAFPVSSAQKRLFLVQKMSPMSTGYNAPSAVLLQGKLDRGRFAAALRQIIARHEALRTSFLTVEGEPVQVVHPTVDFEITCTQAALSELDAILHSFVQPFDLTKAPLMRAALVQLEDEKHVLLFDMHHIIADGTSGGILASEFALLYSGSSLPKPPRPYRDYAAEQQLLLGSAEMKRHEAYWLSVFSGPLPVLKLPLDKPRPAMQSFRGSSIGFEADLRLTRMLKQLASQNEATLFMVLLAAYKVLLARLGGQEDVIVGTPIAGRQHADWDGVIGMFAGTAALRSYPEGNKTFESYLREVKEAAIGAFEHQDYPFEELVGRLGIIRDFSRNPLFDTAFALQNMEVPQVKFPQLSMEPYPFDKAITRFDLRLEAAESEEGIAFTFEYCTDLFHQDTIRKMADSCIRILEAVTSDPSRRIRDIVLVDGETERRISEQFSKDEAQMVIDFDL
ncbi:amino acid adenylation domain-containing protein [Paenibacillus mucilaginosus KNP414]|uniref:Phenyloxazoline synthase MbtB n=2 Tax=Paenibacillus mucilaginosus TaxID=61624 RepID=F8FJP5_PAEMK|nr:amino acid adenylation domain-containing protein [Paenibacillus mucilaginosus KNP414]